MNKAAPTLDIPPLWVKFISIDSCRSLLHSHSWFFGPDQQAPTLDIPSIHIFLSSEMSVLETIENEGNKPRPVKKISLFERSEFEIFRALAYFLLPVR